jgi:tRNA modification GTPase
METIFALSTAPGKAGVAVIRVSGPDAAAVCKALCGALPAARRAELKVLRDRLGDRIDDALVLFFPDGASFTGEPVVEFQTHGSPAVIAAILRELSGFSLLRPALPGETEAQRRQALRGFTGELARECEIWRRSLLRAAALLEVTIDFADEEVPVDVAPEVRSLLSDVTERLVHQIRGVGVAERVRSGFEVAIVGAPNVGKSTLLNRLAGREAAITSEYAGTTRDVIEVRMDLGGLPVTVLDTAGLRETNDAVESIGIGRARERAKAADVRVFLVEGMERFDDLAQQGDIYLGAKVDRSGGGNGISGLTGEGVDALIAQLTEILQSRVLSVGMATRVRHGASMRQAIEALGRARDHLDLGESATDLAAADVHTAIRALDSLVGRIDVEAVLGEIFASFCLGK